VLNFANLIVEIGSALSIALCWELWVQKKLREREASIKKLTF
jgi:hypothetical protein